MINSRNKIFLLGVILSIALALSFTLSSPVNVYAANQTVIDGDWIITSDTVISNTVIILNGNLIVDNDASLTLDNVTLYINSTSTKILYIEVRDHARLNIYNSLIKPLSLLHLYYITAYSGSFLNIQNSTIAYPGVSEDNPGISLFSTATLSNVTIYHGYYGLYLANAANVTLENVKIVEPKYYGIYVEQSFNLTSLNVHVHGGSRPPLYIRGDTFNQFYHYIPLLSDFANDLPIYFIFNEHDKVYSNLNTSLIIIAFSENITVRDSDISFGGAYVWYSSKINFINNTIHDGVFDGIYMYRTDGGTIKDNILHDLSRYAIYLVDSPNYLIENNLVYNSIENIYLDGAHNAKVLYNEAFNCTYGINVWFTDNATFLGNKIHDSAVQGIFVWGSTNNTVTQNEFYNNKYGIYVRESSGNFFYLNNIYNNTYNAYMVYSEPNIWDNGALGNYWDDYTGVDLNNDSIGDTPYVIDDNNQDRYPLMYKFQEYLRGPVISNVTWAPFNPKPSDVVHVTAHVYDPNGVDTVLLAYLINDQWFYTEMSLVNNSLYEGYIPQQPSLTWVYFKIIANDTFGNIGETGMFSYQVIDVTPPVINNITWTPEKPKASDTVTVHAKVYDDSSIDTVLLFYSDSPENYWNTIVMHTVSDLYEGEIPSFPEFTTVYFYIFANDTYGNTATSSVYNYSVVDSTPPQIDDIWWNPENPTPSDAVTVYAAVSDSSGISHVILMYSTNQNDWASIEMVAVDEGLYTAEIPPHLALTTVYFKIFANDTFGNIVLSSVYSYQVIDNTPPTISDISWNPTDPRDNESVTVSAIVTDESGVSMVLLYCYTSINETIYVFNLEYSNGVYLGMIPAFPEFTTVYFYIFANDTYGNEVVSDTYNYSVIDSSPPTINSIWHVPETPSPEDNVTVYASIDDATGVDTVLILYNTSENDLFIDIMTQIDVNLFVYVIPSYPATTNVTYRVIANDTLGNKIESDMYCYEVIDSQAPTISNITYTPTAPTSSDNVTVEVTVYDISGVSKVLLYYKVGESDIWNCTTMNNIDDNTYVGFIPNYPDLTVITFKIFANDTFGNEAYSKEYSYTVVDTTPPELVSVSWEPSEPTSEDSVIVHAIVRDPSGIDTVILQYRTDEDWTNVSMTWVNDNEYIGEIPAFPESTVDKFRIIATDTVHNTLVSEEYNYTVLATPDYDSPAIHDVFWIPEQPSENEPVTVYANISDPSGVDTVILYYYIDGKSLEHAVIMEYSQSDGYYVAEIPGYPAGTKVDFIIFANDTLGNEGYSATYSYTVNSNVDSTTDVNITDPLFLTGLVSLAVLGVTAATVKGKTRP
ncbi:MAG: right-handed parallel beta-helix repeat-containing protein [Candidatus Asgardarchaeia archaeon]